MSSSTSTQPGPSDESIKIGYVRRAHGIRGAVIVRPLTDGLDRFVVGSVLTSDNGTWPSVTIEAMQAHKDGLLVTFEGIGDRTTAETLRGTSFLIDPAQRRDLGGDEFWPDQLVGLRIVDGSGAEFGSVVDVVTGAAQDRLQVDGPDGLFEIPFVAAIVTNVDLADGVVVVDMPAGMATPGS